MFLIKHSHPLFELLFSPLLSLSPHTFSLLLSPPPLNMMRFGERESSRRSDTDTLKNGTATTFICRESGDHVHFPPRHHARSPRPRHAPSWIFSSGSELNFRADNYKECRKNQATQFGCTAYDGCGEFVATDDDSLKCAACGCHRSYHRRDPADFPIHGHDNGVGSDAAAAILNALKLPALQSRQICSSPSDYGGQDGKDLSTGECQKKNLRSSGGGGEATTTGTGKRFKSKFTAEQKERMSKYAEKIGWKMRNESGEEVNKFCAEIGVKRENFRVWMNNHKTKSSAS